MLDPDLERIVSGSLLRIRMQSPFFATLALFTYFHSSKQILTAATDGKNIFVNRDFLRSLSSSEVDGLLLHEVLHAALLHVPRIGGRIPEIWNIAADIIVNGMILQETNFKLPSGGIRSQNLENFSVEEVYEILLKDINLYSFSLSDGQDLLDQAPGDVSESESNTIPGSLESHDKKALNAHWKAAIQQALVIARTCKSQGELPPGLQRELANLSPAQLDWRSYLWRYLVKTPTDFSGFDRRFIGRGLYLETLEGESVQVFVAIDTSGSIDDKQMQLFLSEVVGIIDAYPHLKGELYYVDAEAYGPYQIDAHSRFPKPIGGGGTSFIPFFKQVKKHWDRQTSAICVYLTDGYGLFPTHPPELPVLWVVTPGGLDLAQFPFGETVRLLSTV